MYNILITDDDHLMRASLRIILSGHKDFQVVGEAASGREAISFCRSHTVDLIFMDIIMPGMTGLAAGKIIKKEFPEIEICILSAYSDFHFAKEALEIHVKKYFSKPVMPEDISAYLEKFHAAAKRTPCSQIPVALGLVSCKDFWKMYRELSSMTTCIFEESGRDPKSIKASFLEVGQALLSSLEYTDDKNDIEECYPLLEAYLTNEEIAKLWIFKIMNYVYQQKSIRRYPILEGVFSFIEQHLKEKISLKDITTGTAVSQGYLSRIFRSQLGISVMEYIRLRKIHIAKANFVFTTNSTADVAYMLGFHESSYLQKVFQKLEGISIQEFKSRLERDPI